MNQEHKSELGSSVQPL